MLVALSLNNMASPKQLLSRGLSSISLLFALCLTGCGGEADTGDDGTGTGGSGTGGSGTTCKEGDVLDDGCNTCTCDKDGSLTCTLIFCPETCTDGDTKIADDGCNTCGCTDNAWACTKKACEVKACGARAGDTCSDTEYCAYTAGDYCGGADATASCQPRPEVCDAIYAPVCGCNGKTYASDCAAASAGTGVMSEGECP